MRAGPPSAPFMLSAPAEDRGTERRSAARHEVSRSERDVPDESCSTRPANRRRPGAAVRKCTTKARRAGNVGAGSEPVRSPVPEGRYRSRRHESWRNSGLFQARSGLSEARVTGDTRSGDGPAIGIEVENDDMKRSMGCGPATTDARPGSPTSAFPATSPECEKMVGSSRRPQGGNMEFGVFVATKIDDWQLIQYAEQLGYDRAWIPDSQMIWSDCYATLALAAPNTARIKLGTGVAIPGTRIAPVTAHSIASINRIAPGRVFLGIGTGHTAMRCMGMNPMKIRDFREYLRVVRALLRGEEV